MTPELRAQQAARAVNFAEARRILSLYPDRLERYEKSGGKAIDIRKAIEGGPRTSPDPSRVNPLLDWLVRVSWAGYSLDPNPHIALRIMAIIIARTTRRIKSPEQSWKQIAHEMDDTEGYVSSTFRRALPIFLAALDAHDVTAEINPGAKPIAIPATPIRYASAEVAQDSAAA